MRLGAPAVDEGDPPWVFALLRRELAPAPGRLGNTLRLVVLVLIAVTISETFRLPETALSAYVVLFISRSERASTVLTAVVAGVAAVAAVLAGIVVFMATLSQPALRLPVIAAITFGAMFLSRASPLGPALFPAGFIVAYGLTLGDEVLGLALQPGSVADTAEFSLPELAFIPPEEALVHFMLWLALAVAIPVALVVVANLLTGRDPALLLRAAVGERLRQAGRFCNGGADAERALTALAREGSAGLLRLHGLSRVSRRRASEPALIGEVSRLSLVLLAFRLLPASAWPRDWMAAAAGFCRDAEAAVRDGTTLAGVWVMPAAAALEPAARPLVAELARSVMAIEAALAVAPGVVAAGAKVAKPPLRFLVADAWSNPVYLRFALKVTLAVMLCYAVQDLTDWPGIHTCIITCFFVALGTVGETVHKAALRIGGCLVGGGLGIGTILLLMPAMTDLGDLLAVLAVATFVAGWVGSGSERIAYAGWQIGLAFYLTVLQGYGPTLDMATARDRIVGIVIGNVVAFAIFAFIWPVSVGAVVRGALGTAAEQLAVLLGLQMGADGHAAEAAPVRAFGAAIAQARGMLVNDRYEPVALRRRQRPVDASVLLQVQALLVPVSVILDLRSDPAWAELPAAARDLVLAHHEALADWFRRCGVWVRSGTGAPAIAAELPPPPTVGLRALSDTADATVAGYLEARATWYELLHRDIRAILDEIAPPEAARMAAPIGVVGLAAT